MLYGNLINNASINGRLTDSLQVDLYNAYGNPNRPMVVTDEHTTVNAIPNMAWGIRKVFYISSNQIILTVHGIKKDSATPGIWMNVYNFGNWVGWKEK